MEECVKARGSWFAVLKLIDFWEKKIEWNEISIGFDL